MCFFTPHSFNFEQSTRAQVDPIVASFCGGAVGVLSTLLVVEVNNKDRQAAQRCVYCEVSNCCHPVPECNSPSACQTAAVIRALSICPASCGGGRRAGG